MKKHITFLVIILFISVSSFAAEGFFVNRYSVKPTTLNLRADPSTDSQIVAKLEKGDLVTINEWQSGWVNITTELKGDVGWTMSKYLNKEPSESNLSRAVSSNKWFGAVFNFDVPSLYILIAFAGLSLLLLIPFPPLQVVLYLAQFFLVGLITIKFFAGTLTWNELEDFQGYLWVALIIGYVIFSVLQFRHLTACVTTVKESLEVDTTFIIGILAWPICAIAVCVVMVFCPEYLMWVFWAFVAAQVIQFLLICFSSERSFLWGVLGAIYFLIVSITSMIILCLFAYVILIISLTLLFLSLFIGQTGTYIGTYTDMFGNVFEVFLVD